TAFPSAASPADVLRAADETDFDGCILLNISSVGTSSGIDPAYAELLRSSSAKQLYYGGGVRSAEDLQTLADAGFDGAIVATAVHRGTIPLEIVREGSFC
ncbi:MAG: nickel transporter, partial [Methanocalculaceae archaeon]|nr:nickel transporter [Methanocalculaceae archaeon]